MLIDKPRRPNRDAELGFVGLEMKFEKNERRQSCDAKNPDMKSNLETKLATARPNRVTGTNESKFNKKLKNGV